MLVVKGTDLSLWMTILDGYGLCSYLTRMSLLRSFVYSAKKFKMKKKYALLQFKVTTGESLKTRIFIDFVSRMKFVTTFLHHEHHNKMVWLGERLGHCKRRLESCLS